MQLPGCWRVKHDWKTNKIWFIEKMMVTTVWKSRGVKISNGTDYLEQILERISKICPKSWRPKLMIHADNVKSQKQWGKSFKLIQIIVHSICCCISRVSRRAGRPSLRFWRSLCRNMSGTDLKFCHFNYHKFSNRCLSIVFGILRSWVNDRTQDKWIPPSAFRISMSIWWVEVFLIGFHLRGLCAQFFRQRGEQVRSEYRWVSVL
jgi:hypothetical protein